MLLITSKVSVLRKSNLVFRKMSTNLNKLYQDQTGYHKIETTHTDPLKLFQEWFQEHIGPNTKNLTYRICCLSTASKNGDVSARSVVLKRLDDDGFVILTDSRSLKGRNINENPQACLVFFWNKIHSYGNHSRQARVKGSVKKLTDQENEEIFKTEPLFSKIRANICHQGTEVSWDEQKKKHDELLERYHNDNNVFVRPSHTTAYKIYPQYLEFYETHGVQIGDRLLFEKSDQSWNIKRLSA